MKKLNFCAGWTFRKEGGAAKPVTLPHDAQVIETRAAEGSDAGHGFYPGGVYIYENTFTAPAEWSDKTVLVEFEGVYRNATVSLNGRELAFHPYGYTTFAVELEGLNVGENTLSVRVDNSQLANSRWYSGAGIYRPVWLYVGGEKRIAREGVRVTTLSLEPARVRVDTDATGGDVFVEVLDGGEVVACGEGASVELEIPSAELWSAETPHLYDCRVTLRDGDEVVDEVCEKFGIRMLSWSPKGFFVNGVETLLRGGCVHHDNGILGAATYDESEWRRVRILKENGFNAIRSAHNPTSRALLEACDALGMYVMDEAYDMWYQRKTKYDYALYFEEWWQRDAASMVTRDYNHPSVVMYSIGNEISEPAEERGLELAKAQIELIHSLDATRPVTAGLNLVIMANTAAGNPTFKPDDDKKDSDPVMGDAAPVNMSLEFNKMVGQIGAGMNNGANAPEVDALTTPFLDMLDIAGYNYASGRYPLEETAHPDRVVVGSETFPQDIWKNWQQVKKYPYLIGDFMWTSWDYLGEAGIGSWSYDGQLPFRRPYPWLLAGAGVIDILGNPDASAKYAAVVWEQAQEPVIGVRPPNHDEPVVMSMWRGTNAIESWSWSGCEGRAATVEVYANAASVELLLNGVSLGKKDIVECKAEFEVAYAPGTLEAVAYAADGSELSRGAHVSASGRTTISIRPESESASEGELVYVPIELVGENGIVESNADRRLAVSVDGGELLAFGSANPKTEEQFHSGSYTTYYGRALAIVRSQGEPLTITVTDGCETASARIG